MSFVPIGPAQILLGNPVTESGAGMNNLGDTENVSIDLGLKTAYTSSAQRQGAAHADSVYYMTPEPVLQAELKDASVDVLDWIILNGVKASTSMGFGDSFSHRAAAGVSNLPSMACIPETQKASGVAALNGIWFPRCVVSGLSGIQFGRVSEGEINQPYSVEMRAAYAATDQAPLAITAGFRMGFMGPAANAGAGPAAWSLPALT
tara:strand:- start:4366 stop:4980 length:615 start_codon:yes stop_codon:yes gene_type:complete